MSIVKYSHFEKKPVPVALLETVDCQGHLADGGNKWNIYMYSIFESYERNWPRFFLSDIDMLDGNLNVQLGARLLKVHYPKLKVMHGVEHTV